MGGPRTEMGDDYPMAAGRGPQLGRHAGKPLPATRPPTPEDTMTPTTPRGPVLTLVAMLGLALTLVLVNGATTRDAAAVPVAAAPAAVTAAVDPAPPMAAPRTGRPRDRGGAWPPTAAFPATAKLIGEAPTAKGPIPIEITVDGGRAKAYVCNKIEVWLQGTAEDGVVELTGRKGARLSRDAHRRRGRGHRGAGRTSRVDVLRRADDEHPCRARPSEPRSFRRRRRRHRRRARRVLTSPSHPRRRPP